MLFEIAKKEKIKISKKKSSQEINEKILTENEKIKILSENSKLMNLVLSDFQEIGKEAKLQNHEIPKFVLLESVPW